MNILFEAAKEVISAESLKRISFIDSENSTAIKLVSKKLDNNFEHLVIYNAANVDTQYIKNLVWDIFIQITMKEITM